MRARRPCGSSPRRSGSTSIQAPSTRSPACSASSAARPSSRRSSGSRTTGRSRSSCPKSRASPSSPGPPAGPALALGAPAQRATRRRAPRLGSLKRSHLRRGGNTEVGPTCKNADSCVRCKQRTRIERMTVPEYCVRMPCQPGAQPRRGRRRSAGRDGMQQPVRQRRRRRRQPSPAPQSAAASTIAPQTMSITRRTVPATGVAATEESR